ncbi:hypothetical protein [Mangrovicella endophytica]|uniref:hypothetical protein n=1 Tax=Mangrovicella endophytica TaxID=2066697 RepID=UPI000C9E7D8B|nr:hypothetical protein [Mangrovicella endophytica]
MIRFVIRLVGMLVLAAAVVFAVGDIARTIADDVVQMTPLATALATLGLAPALPPDAAAPLQAGLAQLLAAPTSIVLAVFAFIILFIGRPTRPRRLGALR